MISIIIPTFNRRDLLPAAITSAVNQIGVEVEVIVVDDGSIDNTQELVKTQAYPVKYFYQVNRGTSAARNLGLCRAEGEFVIFLDSDDVLLPQKALTQVSILKGHPDLSVAYSRWKTVTIDGVELREGGVDCTPNVLSTLLYKNIAPPHACLFRTNAVREIGGFDEGIVGCEDWDLLLTCALRGFKFSFSPEITVLYRLHTSNMSYDRKTMLNNVLKLVNKVFNDPNLPHKYRGCYDFVRCIQYLETIRRCFQQKEYANAKLYLDQMFLAMPFTTHWISSLSIDQIIKNKISSILDFSDLSTSVSYYHVEMLKGILENYIKSL